MKIIEQGKSARKHPQYCYIKANWPDNQWICVENNGSTMTRLPEIWLCINLHLPRGQWFELEYIYEIVENNIKLDTEDYEPQAPASDVPKWKRNVRNVLQYRKRTEEIEWDGAARYKL